MGHCINRDNTSFPQETEGCEWFTHDSINDACYTFETCADIDESCAATCVSGEDDCDGQGEPQPSSIIITLFPPSCCSL